MCVLWVRWCAKTGIHSHKLLLYLSNKNHNWLIIEEVFYFFLKSIENEIERSETEMNSNRRRKKHSKKEKNKHETQLQLNYILWVCLNTIHTHYTLHTRWISTWFVECFFLPHQKWPCTIITTAHTNTNTEIQSRDMQIAPQNWRDWFLYAGFPFATFYHFFIKSVMFSVHTQRYTFSLSLSFYLTNCHIS